MLRRRGAARQDGRGPAPGPRRPDAADDLSGGQSGGGNFSRDLDDDIPF